MATEFGRRDLIKITAGAALASGFARAAGQPKFFTPEEYSLVNELTELIIPADEKSGGAKAAKVADYLDARLVEAVEDEVRDDWRNGLKLVNAISREMFGAPFLQGTTEQRTGVLARMAKNELQPKLTEELFFVELKTATIKAYYTSRIGIHDEMDYKGNTYQSAEYTGYLPGERN